MPTNVLNYLCKQGINSKIVQSVDCNTPPPTVRLWLKLITLFPTAGDYTVATACISKQ